MNNNNEASTPLATKEKRGKQPDIMIPKYRFDQVNLCLKGTKQTLKEKTLELDSYKAEITRLKRALFVSEIETATARQTLKDFVALEDATVFSSEKMESSGTVQESKKAVLCMKSRGSLFSHQQKALCVSTSVKNNNCFQNCTACPICKTEKEI